MAAVDYPATLPQRMLREGFNHAAPDTVIRTPMDAGPAKQRRRFTGGPGPVTGKIQVTTPELAIFKDWHRNDLLDGALRFNWTDPDDGLTPVEMRFVTPPQWTETGPGRWTVTLDLEIMP